MKVGDSVAAAAAAAATPAATAAERTRLPGGAGQRKGRELPGDLRRAALGASDLHVSADEFLEALLALHAHVFVDGHCR